MKVSVIIPTFNRADLITRAVDSVLKQAYTNFELLVIDDGSTDSTVAVLKKIHDPRLKVISLSKNQGQNAALNRGLSEASGDYIAFLDSDDLWLSDMLEKHMQFFGTASEIFCSYSYAGKMQSGVIKPVVKFVLEGQNYKMALRQLYVSHMITLIIDRRCLEKVDGFDENFTVCQDDDFCLRLARFYPFHLIKEPLAVINETEGSLISNKLNYAQGWKRLFDKFEQDLKINCGYWVWLYHKVRIANLFLKADDKIVACKMVQSSGLSLSSNVSVNLLLISFYYRVFYLLNRLKII